MNKKKKINSNKLLMGISFQNSNEKIEDKIINLIKSKIKEITSSEKKPLILISTGAYCPPHKVHIQNFIICKNQIKSHNLILGLISPSHDNYIKYKNPYPWNLNSKVRLKLLNSIIKEENQTNFLLADSWESQQDDFVDFPSVFQLRGKEIKDICKNQFNLNIDFGFIMGADLVVRTRCMQHMAKIGVLVIIIRPDWDNNIIFEMKKKLDNQLQDRVFILQPDDNYFCDSMSSTYIRNLFDEGNYDKVIQYTSKESVNILNEYFKKCKNNK